MIFFLPWVVFILVAIMAVPIAHMMDKKKARARFGDDHLDDAFGQMEDDDALQDVQEDNNMALEEPEAVDNFGAEPLAAADGFDDDLSAFE